MARGDGRVSWISWPATLICLGVVGALVWLAVPAIPGAVDFVGSTLRGATSAPAADGEGAPAEPPATDCRSLYPDRLWAELTWTPEVLLSQNEAVPATSTALVAALSPEVRISCSWRIDDARNISTSVSTVGADAAVVAQAALALDGFACAIEGERVHCTRSSGDGVDETHDFSGETWVSTQARGWTIEDYAEGVAARAFGG